MKDSTKKLVTIALFCALLFASACMKEEEAECDISCPSAGARAIVTNSDFTVGSVSILYGDPPSSVCTPCVRVGGDTAVRVAGSRVYVINRWGEDNIQVLAPENSFETALQFSTGNGTNPQDIVVINANKAFVSRLQNAKLLVVNPSTGAILDEVDLSAWADADGVPESARMLLIDNRLFVALQRLDTANWFTPTDKSSIAVINTDNNQVVTVIDLATTNPVTRLVYSPAENKIYVGCAGFYQSFGYTIPDGGVETVTVDTATDTYTPDGLVIDEATLGGDVNAIAVVSATQAYALISDAMFMNYLVRFNPTAGTVDNTLWISASYMPDMILDSHGYIYLADRALNNHGIRIFDTGTDQIAGAPLGTPLPPYALDVFP